MAEPLSRSQILQQQIDNLQRVAPPPLTQAERDQIMKSRRGQADIDEGRRAIAEREKAVSEHSAKVNDLLGKLDSAIRDEGGEASRREREANASPLWNTYIPSAAGVAGGAALGEAGNALLRAFNKGNARAVIEIGDELGPVREMTNSQMNRSISSGAAKAAERYAPSTVTGKLAGAMGRIGGYAAPSAVIYNEFLKYQERANDPSRTESDRLANQAIANTLLGTSTGIALDGGLRVFYPPREPGEGRALARINAARDYASRMDQAEADRLRSAGTAGTSRPLTDVEPMERLRGAMQTADAPASLPAPQSTPQPPTRNSATLINAAKASGASGRMTKASAAEHLLANINDSNRGTIARALGVPNGPNLHSRVLQAIRTMASKPGASAVLAGIVGASAASTNPAEAADGSPVSGLGDRAIAGGAAAGGAYGLSRLVNALKPAARGAISMAGEGMAPLSIDSMTDYSQDDLATANNWMAQNLPTWAMPGPARQVHDMSQLPERNPARGEGPPLDQVASQPPAAPAETSPPPEDPSGMSEFDQLVMASEQDPELAAMLRDAILARVQQANEQQIPNAMASQAVALRGADPMAAALRNFAQR